MDYTSTTNNVLRLVEPDINSPTEVDKANILLEEAKNTFTDFIIVGYGANEHKGLIKVLQTENLDVMQILWLNKVLDKYISDSIVKNA